MPQPRPLNPTDSVFAETLGQAPPNQRLRGRKLLIVGGGQRPSRDDIAPPIGNGRAISVLCAREGASLVVLDANHAAAEATVAQINAERHDRRSAGSAEGSAESSTENAAKGSGNSSAKRSANSSTESSANNSTTPQAVPYTLDVRNPEGIRAAVSFTAKTLGGLDGVVLVVGISKGLSLAKMTTAAWDDDFAVNVRSHMLVAQAALEVVSPGAAIVVMSSLASITAGSRNPAYETSKAAQLGLVRAIAKAGEGTGVRCNGIAPGYVDTPMGRDASRRQAGRARMVPFGRQATGWEVAYLAVFLLSHEASYVSGQTIFMDGGSSVGLGRLASADGPSKGKL